MAASRQGRRTRSAFEDEGAHAYATRPQLAIAALLHLLSRYPATRKPALAHAIVDHLRMVGEDARLDPALRDCANALIGEWQGYEALSGDDPALPRRLPS